MIFHFNLGYDNDDV